MKFIIFILILLCYNPLYAFEKQDCNIMKYETDNVTLGFKVGGLLWGVGPEVSFGSASGVKWGKHMQYMVAEYQELCSRYNTGRVSQIEYDKEIQRIIERSRSYVFKVNQMFREKKNSIFNELESEVSK